jgi:hypothetical protein
MMGDFLSVALAGILVALPSEPRPGHDAVGASAAKELGCAQAGEGAGCALTPVENSAKIANGAREFKGFVSGPMDLQEPVLEFTVVGAAETAADSMPSMARASADTLELTGAISTPNPCYEVEATLDTEGTRLTLTLAATPKGGFCAQVLAAFEYRAKITGLGPGSYTVVTVYTYPGIGWDEKRHELKVDVP